MRMSLQIILGCMYSGKSTELIARVKRFKSIGMRCLVINHSADTRVGGDFVQTHDKIKLNAIKTDDIMLVNTKGFDVIAIDEAQFFQNLETAVLLMLKQRSVVIIAGLSGDDKTKIWSNIRPNSYGRRRDVRKHYALSVVIRSKRQPSPRDLITIKESIGLVRYISKVATL